MATHTRSGDWPLGLLLLLFPRCLKSHLIESQLLLQGSRQASDDHELWPEGTTS